MDIIVNLPEAPRNLTNTLNGFKLKYELNHLDHEGLSTIAEALQILKSHNCETAIIKKLAKNNNDKNQVYIHKDISVFSSMFDLRFSERDGSTSETKSSSKPGDRIPEAVFEDFSWVSTTGALHKVTDCKAILYAQYPETRLSRFQTNNREMPRSMSVEYTKLSDMKSRYLFIGATKSGAAIAIMVVDPSEPFHDEYKALDDAVQSGVIKFSNLGRADNRSEKLLAALTDNVLGKTLKGCRLDTTGKEIPFNSTQVCGYTLEAALGIVPNAGGEGDIHGIELKAISQKKVTLFTPEPDGGLYKDDFKAFMRKYGYEKETGVFRFTGIHRCNVKSKSPLTMKILCKTLIDKKSKTFADTEYDPNKNINDQVKDLRVCLVDDMGDEAAVWSFEKLLNKWGVKHNETVYVPVAKSDNTNPEELRDGFKHKVTFSDEVLWCKRTDISRLFNAIHDGTIVFDPAPKFVEHDPSKTKKRSQWRLNNIFNDAHKLYEKVEKVKAQHCIKNHI